MRLVLTDLALRKLAPPPSGQLRIFDQNLPAFGVQVGKRSKTFIVMHGRDRRLTTIGRYPEISLQEARKEAKAILATPAPKKRAERLLEAVAGYLDHCEERLRPKSVLAYRSVLKNAPDILLADVSRKTVKVATAHEIKTYKAFMNWCLAEDLADRNPFAHLSAEYGQRERVLSPEELRAVFHYEDSRFSTIVRLLILTGQRVGEIRQLRPEWIEGDTFTIPASVAKNGRSHTVPFNLFTARHLRQHAYFNGFSKSKARMDAALQLPHWTLHDLRRTFATNHARLGTPVHLIERLLNHVSGQISGVAAIYNRHKYLEEARAAASAYEAWLWNVLK